MLVQSTLNLKIDFAISVMGGCSRRAYSDYPVHMAAVLIGCRRPWLTLAGPFLWCTNRSSALVGALFLALFAIRKSVCWSESPDHCKLANE